jgi:hypothetical protein
MKCERCKRKKGVLWFGIMVVCQSCYNDLMEKKYEKNKRELIKNDRR